MNVRGRKVLVRGRAASELLGRATLGETRTLGEAPGFSSGGDGAGECGQGIRADLGSEPTATFQQGARRPFFCSSGLSFPTSTVGTVTPTSSDWDTGHVPPPPASLQSVAPALTEPLQAGAWPQRPHFCPGGGSAAFSWL